MLLKLQVLHNTEGNMNDCQPLKETGSVFQKALSTLASLLSVPQKVLTFFSGAMLSLLFQSLTHRIPRE